VRIPLASLLFLAAIGCTRYATVGDGPAGETGREDDDLDGDELDATDDSTDESTEDTASVSDTGVGGDTDADSGRPTAADTAADTALDTATAGPCPGDMVFIDDVAGPYCIDRYEAHLQGHDPYQMVTSSTVAPAANAAGAVPQGYISGEHAAQACDAAGKRLCTSDEWLRACEGPTGNVYPYGDTYDADACNDSYSGHPIVDVFGSNASWTHDELNDPQLNQLPDSLAASGDYAECVSDEGVYDMHGNLHEWVDDPSGTFRGGFYVDASINGTGCGYRTTAHSFTYQDYSTGFRCCADAW